MGMLVVYAVEPLNVGAAEVPPETVEDEGVHWE
jgi:hypothetical protein